MRRLLRRLARGERGTALILAVAFTAVLSISTATAINYSTSGSQSAATSKASGIAYALAEAGINNAMSVLSLPANNALDSTLLPPPPPSSSARTDTYEGGTVSWGGTLNPSTNLWTLKAVGKVRNPTGAATTTRTITSTSQVVSTLTQPLNNQSWNYVYVTKTGTPGGCDQTLNNGVALAVSLYVDGNLCTNNTSSIVKATSPPTPAPAVNLVVKGSVTNNNTSFIGTTSARINEAHIVGGCNGHSPCRWNGGGDPVWATVVDTTAPAITGPTPDYNYWYQFAGLGPTHNCSVSTGTPPVFENETSTPTRNNSVPGTFNFTPSLTDYTCQRTDGTGAVIAEISWNHTTKVLTVKGAIFIDGSATVTAAPINYNGQATIYLSGTLSFGNTAALCGGISGSTCDFGSWNPNTEMLLFVVNGTFGGASDYGVTLTNSAYFQGGIFATHSVQVANSAQFEGPLVASVVDFFNSDQAKPFPLITTVPIGTPGNPNVYAQPNPPSSFAG